MDFDERILESGNLPPCGMSTGIAETMFRAEAYGIY